MAKKLTEDAVRDKARDILGFKDKDGVRSGVGQITTFNQLGFPGVSDKPDGWYLPDNHVDTAIVLETKASYIALGDKQVDEVLKNVKIVQEQYSNVVGILYNGDDTKVFKGEIEFQGNGSNILQNLEYYTALFNKEHIDKEYIYELTAKINNCLHFEFGIKNLYHRMIFTACALVAKRFDALGFGFFFDTQAQQYKARPHAKSIAKLKTKMKWLTRRNWSVSNRYKIEKLNQLTRGWINYFGIGYMKWLCKDMDALIRRRLRMCIWVHWKTPQNRAQNLMKLGMYSKKAYAIAYSGARVARLSEGALNYVITNKRLASFGLVSMYDYYTERFVKC